MSKPLISIIIPTYNHANTIEACLNTLFNQTYLNLEIIVVNDGSTDRTTSILEKYADKIKIINQTNQGSNTARNRGYGESRGEFVLFSDDDAIYKKSAIKSLYKALQKQTDASYAYSRFKFGWKKFKSQKFNADDLRKMNYIHTSALIRSSHFAGFDESIKRFQDWDLWLTMLKQGRVGVFVPKTLFKIDTGNPVTKSQWFPSFFYKIPWKLIGFIPQPIRDYDEAKEIIIQKHGLD